VTQRKGNRNLSKRLPKRFGYFDLAIESPGSQVGAFNNRFKSPEIGNGKCAAAYFFGAAAAILLQPAPVDL
jgi:hypothetical protein